MFIEVSSVGGYFLQVSVKMILNINCQWV